MFEPGAWENILAGVEKPARYAGGEWHEVRKDPASVDVRVALAFPDVYEIGMSYLGQKILYSVLNGDARTAAERVFAPWPDLEAALLRAGRPLASLENGIPLRDFDIIGFSLLYELNYSNILTMLALGGVPLLARDRKPGDPLVIAGGPAGFNPEPAAEIFDFFVLGDGEEVFPRIVETYRGLKGVTRDRSSLLGEFSRIPAVYVPSLYEPREDRASGLIYPVPAREGTPAVINKCLVSDFRSSHFPEKIVVPSLRVVFDRVAVEAARGCPQACRFCQARSVYFPHRAKDPGFLLKTMCAGLKATGYEDASLSALSIGDYPGLEGVVREFMRAAERGKISLSLSSLRPGMLSRDIVESLLRVRKTGFTLVPEAGTERLRAVINKDLTDAEIREALVAAFRGGWRLVKLYFMIGLPTERDEDLEGIIELVGRCLALGREVLGAPPRLNISLSSFIPKPHTPFQWLAMEEAGRLAEKQRFVRSALRRHRSVELKEHPVESSVLEAVFSRGDRRLGGVLLRAWEKGARFDGWAGSLKSEVWREAFAERGVEPAAYLGAIPAEAVLPWEHIRTGLKKSHLLDELQAALRGQRTPGCGRRDCALCRGCDDPSWKSVRPDSLETGCLELSVTEKPAGELSERLVRYRAFYAKQGKARFLSHIDLVHVIQRSFRRAGIAVKSTEGFHPKSDFAYGPALPLGMAGLDEVLEFRSYYRMSEAEFLERVNRSLPDGLRFNRLETLAPEAASLSSDIEGLVYSFSPADVGAGMKTAEEAAGRLKAFLEQKPGFGAVRVVARDGRVLMELFPAQVRRGSRPQDIIAEAFGAENASFLLRRDAVVLKAKVRR
jgi:radical SAM family uncharacterized protein